MKHIYWFAYYNSDSPSVRYRGIYALDWLRANKGVTYDLVFPGYAPTVILKFITICISILLFRRKNSVVVIQKIYSIGIYSRLLKLILQITRTESFYDIDDAEYLRHDDTSIRYFISHCSGCFVASDALKKYIQSINNRVTVTTSPVIEHSSLKTKRNSVFTIGWVGGYNTDNPVSAKFSHKKSLNEILFPALIQINFPMRLVLIGVTLKGDKLKIEDYFRNKPHIELEIPLGINWHDEPAIYKRITGFDVGVAPLVNHEFNEAKSAFKVKQYLSCGVPALASDIGENKKFVSHGKNGLLCNSSEDFLKGITDFYRMTDESYFEFSSQARNSLANFSMESYCSSILKAVSKDWSISNSNENAN